MVLNPYAAEPTSVSNQTEGPIESEPDKDSGTYVNVYATVVPTDVVFEAPPTPPFHEPVPVVNEQERIYETKIDNGV